jgi:hypothetical protein
VKKNLEDTVLYVLEAFGGVEYTVAFLLLLVWASMLFIVIDQAIQHRHTLIRDRRHRFFHLLPRHLARVNAFISAHRNLLRNQSKGKAASRTKKMTTFANLRWPNSPISIKVTVTGR